jgi:hypothetical protein
MVKRTSNGKCRPSSKYTQLIAELLKRRWSRAVIGNPGFFAVFSFRKKKKTQSDICFAYSRLILITVSSRWLSCFT